MSVTATIGSGVATGSALSAGVPRGTNGEELRDRVRARSGRCVERRAERVASEGERWSLLVGPVRPDGVGPVRPDGVGPVTVNLNVELLAGFPPGTDGLQAFDDNAEFVGARDFLVRLRRSKVIYEGDGFFSVGDIVVQDGFLVRRNESGESDVFGFFRPLAHVLVRVLHERTEFTRHVFQGFFRREFTEVFGLARPHVSEVLNVSGPSGRR